jgi:hypothetical protein
MRPRCGCRCFFLFLSATYLVTTLPFCLSLSASLPLITLPLISLLLLSVRLKDLCKDAAGQALLEDLYAKNPASRLLKFCLADIHKRQVGAHVRRAPRAV